MVNAQKVWDGCLKFIGDNVSEQVFKTWFIPIKVLEIQNNTLKIQVPSKFFYEWLEEHYIKLLKSALNRELGPGFKLVYSIKMEHIPNGKSPFSETIPSGGSTSIAPQELAGIKESELRNPFINSSSQRLVIEPQLNLSHTFESFLEGKSNRTARSVGMEVSKKPGGTSFNPLFIFGNVGLGKTHLANAIGLEAKERYPDKVVLYVSSDKFTQQYGEAILRKSRNSFIHFYQMIDVLIVDDIQLLSGKSGTQDVFFHIYNHLHQHGKQVVFTSDKPPVELQDIESRLLSRFKWGVATELEPPDFNMRVSILKNKLYRDGLEIDSTVLEYIAENVKSSIRELEGVALSLVAKSSFQNKDIDMDLVRKTVANYVKNSKREITVDLIKTTVADHFGLNIADILSKSRKRDIAQARQIAMYFAKKMTKKSLVSIGQEVGKRDHATVLHACKTVINLCETDRQFKRDTDAIKNKLTK
ncbi:chromosomal replication initiator protein DnaA [Elysia marginata]|uniref:Chromosomal replication initiator protein DnaA n=1 Tax=Elysia marginata TaxID=1093978 RepID=A0AAV4FWL3_9GAST|nr:chromosomal replication initiator protein DnaA [Elysia marginata]